MDKNLQYVISADASGFVAGWQQMAAAMQAVQKMFGDVERGAEGNAGSTAGLVQRAREYEQAVHAQTAAQQQFLQSLQQRVETSGLDPEQMVRYRAAQLGVSTQAEVLVQRLQEVRAASEAKAAADAKAVADAREAERAVRAQTAAQQQFLQSMRERVETAGLKPEELLRYRAAQLGVSEQADHLIQKLHEQGKAGQISAGQMNAAMRTVPAQFTDIITQLQGGQNPFTILLQQGGQLRDSFGGFGNMFAGLATFITPVAVAVAGFVAVVGSVGYAFMSGQKESDAFALALRNTGNASGLTATKYDELARSAAQATGASIGSAREAGAAAVASGEFGAAAIGPAIQAITAYARATGVTAQEAAQNFKGIGKDAAKWAEEQNNSLHFLTIETYTHIRSLQEQGRAQEAAAVAMEAMTRQLSEQPQHLGWIERAAHSAGNAMSAFWDMAKGIGKADTVGEQIDQVAERLKKLEASKPNAAAIGGWAAQSSWERERAALTERQAMLQEQARIEQKAAAMKAEQAEKTQQAIEATKKIEHLRDENASPAEKRDKEIKEYRRHAAALKAVGQEISAEQQKHDEAAIAAKHKDQKPAEKSHMGKFEEELANERHVAAERDALHSMSQKDELAFWENIARTEKMSASDRISVQRKISDLKTAVLKDEAQQAQQIGQITLQASEREALAQIDQEQEAARRRQQTGQMSAVELLEQEIQFETRRTAIRRDALQQQLGGLDPTRDTVKVAQTNAQIQALEVQHNTRVSQIRGSITREQYRQSADIQMTQLRSWEEQELSKVGILEEEARRSQSLGQITKTALLQQEEAFEQRKQAIRMQALSSQIDAIDPANDPVKYAQLKAQIETLEAQHQQRLAQIRGQAAVESAREQAQVWDSLQQHMSGLWDQGVNAMMNGTLTWKNAQKAIGSEMVMWFMNSVIKPRVGAWLLGETTKTSATVAGVTARGTAETAGSVQSVALWAMTATKNIMSSAWEAMAGAWKAMIGVPYIGPVLAVGAAAAAFAGVSALASKVKSARGGYDIPSGTNPLTQLHEEEMVLPRRQANTIRALGALGFMAMTALQPEQPGRLPLPAIDPMAAMHAPATASAAQPGGFARGAVAAMSAAGMGGERISAPVTYNDHSGRLTADDLRRNANVLGDIWAQQVKNNRIRA